MIFDNCLPTISASSSELFFPKVIPVSKAITSIFVHSEAASGQGAQRTQMYVSIAGCAANKAVGKKARI